MATTGRPEAIGSGPLPGHVVHGPGRTAAVRAPGGTQRGAAQEERVERHRPGPQQPGRRQEPSADDVEVARSATVGSSRSLRSRNANDSPSSGSASNAPRSAVEVRRGERCPFGLLERPGVEDDPEPARERGALGPERAHERAAAPEQPVAQLLGPQLDDDDERLDDDPARHLALARRVGRGR